MTAGFYTLGCKLNQSETEALADAFRRAGHTAVDAGEEADLYILNTCTVTSKSEQKARRALRKILSERGAPVVITGCYAEVEKARLLEEFGSGVFAAGMEEKARLLDLPAFLSGADASACRDSLAAFFSGRGGAGEKDSGGKFRFAAERYSFHTRAFLKIQDGCDYRCSYCRVCVARGPSVSLDAEELLRRFRSLEAEGYREIVLTGINLMLYASGPSRLGDILQRLLEKGSSRIRLSSLEPEGVTPALARVLSHPRVCPHFHLPLQSGSDSVLRAMARRYTRSRAAEAVALLRSAKKTPFIAADIITGFPGETDADHAQTESLARETGLASLHVFPFSRRPGTPAWDMGPRVPERVSRDRAAALRAISRAAWKNFAAGLAGNTLEVLVEKRGGAGEWEGLAENYITVRGKEAPLPGKQPEAAAGSLLLVKALSAEDGFVWGEIA